MAKIVDSGTAPLEHKSSRPAPKKAAKRKSGKALSSIHTRVNADGSFTHQHTYEDANGIPDMKQPEYTSQTVDDVHDHMDQHLGDGDGDDAQAPQGGGDPTSMPAAAPQEGAGE